MCCRESTGAMESRDVQKSCALGPGVPWHRWKYYGLLLLVIAVAFATLCSLNMYKGKSLFWLPDALALYYNFFVFEGEWLRGILSSIGQPDFAVPLYSFDIGYGADIVATMGSCLNDPFNLISVFCPPAYAEYVFEALTFVRFFLAAVAFSVYSFSKGNGRAATLCGALCYSLCGFMVLWGVLRHPNFINVAILFPLILRGADKVFENRSPVMLIVTMGALFFFSLYFSYMVLLILVVYCAIKYAFAERDRSVVDFLKLFGRFLLYLAIAALLAGVMLVPFLHLLTSMDRLGVQREGGVFDTFAYYWQYAGDVLGVTPGKRGVVVGVVPALAMIALAVAGKTIDRRVRMPWLIGIALCFAGTLLPVVGKVMNGFSYSTDRWMFAWGFCAAYAVVLVITALKRFGVRQWATFGGVSALFVVWVAAWGVVERSRYALVGAALLALAAVAMAVAGRRFNVRTVAATLGCMALVTMTFSVVVSVGRGEGYVDEFAEAGRLEALAQALPLDAAPEELDADYRIDHPEVYGTRNQSLAQGFKGIDFYSSFYNQNVDNFRRSLGLADMQANYIFNGHDSRLALEALFGVRYFVATDEHESRVPFGYRKVADLGETLNGDMVALYQCDEVLPLAFIYDTAVPQSTYDALDMPARQELLTKACVVADGEVQGVEAPVELPASSAVEQSVAVKAKKGVLVTDGCIEVFGKNGTVEVTVAGVEDAENYVVFEGLRMAALDPQGRALARAEAKGKKVKDADWWAQLTWKPNPTAMVTVSTDATSYCTRVSNGWHVGFSGKTEWLFNMGYSAEKVQTYTLEFARPGRYSFDKLYVASQPVAPIAANVKALKDANDASVDFGVNQVNIAVAPRKGTDARYVFLSVPYSSGWTATVDGRPADILRANVGFMAFEVDGGAHEIMLTYETPGLKAGALCSLAGLAAFAALVASRRKRARNEEARKS